MENKNNLIVFLILVLIVAAGATMWHFKRIENKLGISVKREVKPCPCTQK